MLLATSRQVPLTSFGARTQTWRCFFDRSRCARLGEPGHPRASEKGPDEGVIRASRTPRSILERRKRSSRAAPYHNPESGSTEIPLGYTPLRTRSRLLEASHLHMARTPPVARRHAADTPAAPIRYSAPLGRNQVRTRPVLRAAPPAHAPGEPIPTNYFLPIPGVSGVPTSIT